MNNILRTERLIDMKQINIIGKLSCHAQKQTNKLILTYACSFFFCLFVFVFLFFVFCFVFCFLFFSNQFAQNPEVLNFELGTDVRPKVSTTTL